MLIGMNGAPEDRCAIGVTVSSVAPAGTLSATIEREAGLCPHPATQVRQLPVVVCVRVDNRSHLVWVAGVGFSTPVPVF